jgi:ABC-type antimicrobial peptide transport system permease subunit
MSPGTGHVRGLILAVQIAIAAVLVLSATLLARGIGYAVSAPAGFALQTTTAVTLEPPANQRYDTERADDVQAAIARAAHGSGLLVGMAGTTPASVGQTSIRLPNSEIEFRCTLLPLTASAFAVLDLKLVAGRLASDDSAAGEAVINQTLAAQMSPTGSALGKTFTLQRNRRTYSIVGIVQDAHLTSPSDVEPAVHVPLMPGLPVLLARTAPGLEQKIRALVASVDPQLTATLTPLSETVREALEHARLGASIAAALGTVALLLAMVGVFGVFSYVVEERRHEIGIRLALGATRGQVSAAVLQASRGAIAGGLLAGLTLSAIVGIVLRRFLFGMSPADPVSYATVALILSGAAVLATAVPIGRAVSVDPAMSLRAE